MCSGTFLRCVEGGNLLGLLILVQLPIIVDIILLLGWDVNGRVFVVKLLLHLFFLEDGQRGRLIVGFLIFFIRALLLTVVFLGQSLLLLLPLVVSLDILLVLLLKRSFLVNQELLTVSLAFSLGLLFAGLFL